jgi:predicted RNase H-like HicB family nuclease
MHYEVIVEPTAEGGYLAWSDQAPGRAVVATSPDLALEFFKRTVQAWVNTMRHREPWRDLGTATFTWRFVESGDTSPSIAPLAAAG